MATILKMTIVYNTIITLISWLIIYLIEKRNIFKAWIEPTKKRFKEFIKGFSLMAILCVITQLILSMSSNITWKLSNDLNIKKLLSSIYYDINSVLFEEFLFRGVLLYLLIKYLNSRSGVLISSIAFGIYHWYANGVLGNLPAMTLVFLVTGFMGYVFATSYDKTKSLILPIGLHLGWNLTNHNIFSNGPNGIMILQVNGQLEVSNSHQLISFGLYMITITGALLFVKSKYITKQERTIANNVYSK
ncbi:type II CAAX endopeptidase family protein [Limibacter armeniacum]|uniref:CPBP family intramembrane glutamic endopeptidase n=1 Tax=Limibacter armeniacum TaxID=466084 RepID=UPI002FE6B5BB